MMIALLFAAAVSRTPIVELSWVPRGLALASQFEPFGRFPRFVLYDDGTVIYFDESSSELLTAKTKPKKVLDDLTALGFDRIDSYEEECEQATGGSTQCVSDAATSVITVRRPGQPPRTLRNYYNFANNPNALAAIRDYLTNFTAPGATRYLPKQAVLIVDDVHVPNGEPVAWPLLAALLDVPKQGWPVVLNAAQTKRLVAALGSNTGSFRVKSGGKTHGVELVPWMPGGDYTKDVEAYRKTLK